MILVSEAQAIAGQSERSKFVISAPGDESVTLTLTAVGCSCYRVRHGERVLHVGDILEVSAGRSEDVCIDAQVRTSPGVAQYRAEFSGTSRRGTTVSLPLTRTVRTTADLAVRPDVIEHATREVPAHRPAGIELSIEQHVRAAQPAGLRVAWGAIPDWIRCSPPTPDGTPIETCSGVWRARWRSTVHIGDVPEPPPNSPVQLRLESFQKGRRLALTDCTLILKQDSGVQAPELVHFGRVPAGASPTRRVQLIARDGRPFAVNDIASRNGDVAATEQQPGSSTEHWLDVQILASGSGCDDVLTMQTDHPATPRVEIRVRALDGPGGEATTTAGAQQ